MIRKTLMALGAVGMLLLLTAANCSGNSNSKDAALANRQLGEFLVNQPAHTYPWSQLRQNLIEIQDAQANTTQTSSFFFNMGVQDPIMACPSIGFSIPSEDQLTNPQARVPNHDSVVSQIEPTGVYTGHSTGTHVICLNSLGKPYAAGWEGFVLTVTGAVGWDYGKHQIFPVGTPTAQFTTGHK